MATEFAFDAFPLAGPTPRAVTGELAVFMLTVSRRLVTAKLR